MGGAYRRIAWAALLACLPGVAWASEGTGLFSADAGAEPLRWPARRLSAEGFGAGGAPHGSAFPEFPSSGELRSRSARMDLGRLSAARMEVEQGSPSRLSLNLFADAEFEAVIERTAPTASGYTLTGRLADEPLSMVVVAVHGEHVAGTVWSSRGVYSIRARGGISVMRQLDPATFGRCGVGEAPSTSRPDSSRKPRTGGSPSAPQAGTDISAVAPKAAVRNASAVQSDDGGVIDLLVVYPPFVRRYQDGHQAMRALIEQDVAVTNEILRDSGAAFRIELVAAVETDYRKRDTPLNFIVSDLAGESDGLMDEVHALRDTYAADLVVLHWGDWPPPASVAGSAQPLTADKYSHGHRPAFSAVSGSTGWSIMAHVIGHNMGLQHDRTSVFSSPGNPAFRPVYPYGYGYVFQKPSAPSINDILSWFDWNTVMHWQFTGETIPRFSNPNQKWPDESGVPIGVPGDEWSDRAEGPADAVRALNKIRRYVANHRAGTSRCSYALSPVPPTVPATGGVYRIRVETATDCAWMARADGDGFATVTAGSSGPGSGEVAFEVASNAGWDREVAVLVAGEVYAMRQAGTRAVTPVCERPFSISQAISDAVGKPCAEVTRSDLAAVRRLIRWLTPHRRTERDILSTLGPGMLDGLTGLRSLVLREVGITKIQLGAFDGLSNLTALLLEDNDLALLPIGTFDELSNLKSLYLDRNRLTAVPRNTFKGMSALLDLGLSNNDLRVIAPGAFNGLRNLQRLYLDGNKLAALVPGTFDGLPNLSILSLEDNTLTKLDPNLLDWKQLPGLGLRLSGNRLTTLAPSTFDGATLGTLGLQGNSLQVVPGTFNGLRVFILDLSGNGMTKLPVGAFDGLSGLRMLRLHDNRLTTLPVGAFDNLSGLEMLRLHDNRLTALPAGLLRGLGNGLEYLSLDANRLRALPLGLFDGLAQLRQLDLSGNPGAPFPLRLELAPAASSDAERGASLQISVEIAEGAPFDIAAKLSASGAELSTQEILVPRGQTRSGAVSVFPNGDGPVTIELHSAPGVAAHPACREDFRWWLAAAPNCHLGVRAVAGASLVMHGFRDQTLAPEGAVRFHLPTAFPAFGSGTSYAVELSDPSAAEAVVRDGLLIVTATGGGETTLTLTATSPDGRRETRRFSVTALAAPEAIERIPNLSLTAGESIRIDLSDKFRDPNDDSLSYAAETSNPAVATASTEGGALIVAGRAPGVATLTLMATDPGGLSATLSFEVKVEPALRSRWGGWRSALLRPPSSEDGDES